LGSVDWPSHVDRRRIVRHSENALSSPFFPLISSDIGSHTGTGSTRMSGWNQGGEGDELYDYEKRSRIRDSSQPGPKDPRELHNLAGGRDSEPLTASSTPPSTRSSMHAS